MPNSTWTVSGSSLDLAATLTPVSASSSKVDADYLSNADKIAMMEKYAAELQTKTQLDEEASSLSISSSAYDNAVAEINTTLIDAGAPSNWATIWPDGTTFGPVVGIKTLLSNDWSDIASARAALQNSISATAAAQQAAAAQSAAITAAATDATNKMNTAIADAQTYANNAQAAAISSAATTAMQKVDWTTGGDFNGALIANGSILADSLILANYDNLIPNPNSEQSAPPGGWPAGAFEDAGLTATSPYQGSHCRTVTNNQLYISPMIPVSPGDEYYIEAYAMQSGGTGSLVVTGYDQNKSGVGNINGGSGITFTNTSYAKVSGSFTVPSGCFFMQAAIFAAANTTAYFDNFYLRRMADANLIVDGTITGNKLDVASVQTTILTAGVIQSDNIAAGAITVDTLTVTGNANQCTNPNFDSGSLTGWDTSEAPSYIATFATSGLAVPGPHPYAMRLITGDSSSFAVRNLNHVAVTEGQAYIASASFYVNGPLTSGGYAYVRLRGLDAGNNETILATGSPQPLLPSQKWVQGNAQATIPAGIVTVNLEIVYVPPVTDADIFVNGCNLQIATAGALIVDGSIQTSQIAAGAITGDMITAGELIANVIYFNDGGNLQALQPAEAGSDATLGHVINRTVVMTANQSNFTTSPVAITNPNMGFTLAIQSSSDVVNIWSSLSVYGDPSNSEQVTVLLAVDGNTTTPEASFNYQLSAAQGGVFTFLASVSNLSPGSHTLQLYAHLSASRSFEIYAGSTCLCQYVY